MPVISVTAVNDSLQSHIRKFQEQDANNVMLISELEMRLFMKVENDVSVTVLSLGWHSGWHVCE